MFKAELEILYQDESLVAVNKPPGMLVHKSKYSGREEIYLLQALRDQLGKYLYPVHRLDRKTSGIILFALNPEVAKALQENWKKSTVKRYLAIVRGFFPDHCTVEKALVNEKGILQEAHTVFKCLQRSEIERSHGKFKTSRYSLIEAFPTTGRLHQIRKHCNHLRHPIIGDRPHGCNKQNRLFKETWQLYEMLLHAYSVTFKHPIHSTPLMIKADFQHEFRRIAFELHFDLGQIES